MGNFPPPVSRRVTCACFKRCLGLSGATTSHIHRQSRGAVEGLTRSGGSNSNGANLLIHGVTAHESRWRSGCKWARMIRHCIGLALLSVGCGGQMATDEISGNWDVQTTQPVGTSSTGAATASGGMRSMPSATNPTTGIATTPTAAPAPTINTALSMGGAPALHGSGIASTM